ncbi:MAG: sodium/proline symporter [Candidatus Dependentiae bacterium]|nr:sodium/proline symporter [Candidatus Dependentiae bacterium]
MFNSMIEAFIVYFLLLLGIGFYFYHKNKNQNDFALGGRKLNYWVTAISAQASDMSDWLFMGFPGAIYATGLIGIWTAVGLVLFMFLNWHFIAPRFRIATENTNSETLASFLQTKFGDTSNTIRVISGLLCLYFFVFYIAAGLVGLGKIFESAFHINYYHGIILGLAITLTYTLLGGLMAIAWSNLFQGIFLLIAILSVPFYAIIQLGSIHSVINEIMQSQGSQFLSIFSIDKSILSIFFGITTWGLGYFGQPHILISFMSIDNVNNMRKAKFVGISWQILVLTAAILVGIVGKAFIHPALVNQELVFITMVQSLFTPFLAGFILCAMLAATISTINTQSLVSASLISHDLYYPFIKNEISYQQKLFFTRASIFIIPMFALIAAWYNTIFIMDLVHYAWSGLGCSFGPLVILSLYTNFVTPQGAIAGLIVGGLTGIFWPIQHAIPTLVIGFILNFSVTYIVSIFTKKIRR